MSDDLLPSELEGEIKQLSKREKAALASRASLRAIQALCDVSGSTFDIVCLKAFRCILIASSACEHEAAQQRQVEHLALNLALDGRNFSELTVEGANLGNHSHYAFRSAITVALCAASESAADNPALQAIAFAQASILSGEGKQSSVKDAAISALYADVLAFHFEQRVWPDHVPGGVAAYRETFINRLASSPAWDWWRGWYEEMWHGTFKDWDLALEVAKIDWDAPEGESVWDKGPAAVAARIEELKRNRNGEPHFDKARVKDRVQELLKHPNAAASMAEGAASLILKGIADYKREAPANGLPEGLELLEELPAHFSQIAEALRKDGPQAKREEELEAEIKRLNAKIGRLEAEAAKHRALGAVFREEWVRGMAKTLSDKWFVGGMCFGTAYFFGVDVSDFTLENLRGYISELMEAAPADQAPENPPKPVDV